MPSATQITIDTRKMEQLMRQAGRPETFIIADGVEYGVYQEFTQSGHPSLRPAFERVARPLRRAIGQAINRGVNLNSVLAKAAFDIQRLWATDVNVDTGAFKNSIHVEKK